MFGTSLGAIEALDLLIRRPDVVRATILDEPPLYGVVGDPHGALGDVTPLLREAMEAGGPPPWWNDSGVGSPATAAGTTSPVGLRDRDGGDRWHVL